MEIKDVRRLIGADTAFTKAFGEAVAKAAKAIFEAEEKVCRMFCEARGIELPIDRTNMQAHKELMTNHEILRNLEVVRVAHNSMQDGRFVLHEMWCRDLRYDTGMQRQYPFVRVSAPFANQTDATCMLVEIIEEPTKENP